ncbi:hypothetical protein [Granulicella arctica]|uniref:hypothetical protein n=1 Tax=Granulicella arctica TaxID=940613 RepID=UPI0021DF43FA|nr:hypothetical protein [Granulicella arctica]
MAHIIQVPFAIEFATEGRRWELFEAAVVGSARDLQPKPSGIFAMLPVTTDKFAVSLTPERPKMKLPAYLTLSPLYTINSYRHEEKISDYLTSKSEVNPIYSGNSTFEILVSFSAKKQPERERDPWKMREEFLSLPMRTTALAKFLNTWGRWDMSSLWQIGGSEKLGLDRPLCIIPELIWDEQTRYKAALSGDAEEWLSRSSRIPAPQRRMTAPFFAVRDDLCSSAIETTITMDKIAQVPYRLCARSDCGLIFKVESNHSRHFCSQSCAHLVSVRRGREARRKPKKGVTT